MKWIFSLHFWNESSVAHNNTHDDNFVFSVCSIILKKGEDVLVSILMGSVVCLQFSMQEADIIEYTNVKCHLCTL